MFTTDTEKLLAIHEHATSLMMIHGLIKPEPADLSTYRPLNWLFKYDNAKCRFGGCNAGLLEISLSKPLCLANFDEHYMKIVNTIKHEIAHALVYERYEKSGYNRCKAHGREWVEMCKVVGIEPVRCYDSSKVNNVEGKYHYRCPACDYEVYHFRLHKRVNSCGSCCDKYNNGKFSKEYILQLVNVKGLVETN
jgi:predicted SprT family Zn-dependent metalloprotease